MSSDLRGQRRGKLLAAAIHCARSLRNSLHDWSYGHFGDRTLDIDGLALSVDYSDAGGRAYALRAAHEESVSQLYAQIAHEFEPRLVIDIGANYGFTGVVFARHFPHARIVLVEPSPALCQFVERNLRQNGARDFVVIQAICAAQEGLRNSFALNPHSSQDNRVQGLAGWQSIEVEARTLVSLVEQYGGEGGVFIKIDTQGFEAQVFAGGAAFFDVHRQWLVKCEFAPYWLQAQGTDPNTFLRSLIARYAVVECPARFRYARDELHTLFDRPLKDEDVEPFVAHVTALDRDQRGWCDLLVKPVSTATSSEPAPGHAFPAT